ncbi:MAG: ADP-ribosylglycohydrolase family protein [Selenomonadaceae bacterium]|nr:ADP-ribosylglycohydrolase family protein [Selenomonadaceae bacterium]
MKSTALYGAILGDIIGSPYEFDRSVDGVRKTKDFEFFKGNAHFTDDTVLTIAVAEALLDVERNADEETVCNAVVKSMQSWGKQYPRAGYGGRFLIWLGSKNPQPYNSWGNGSAMRVSAVGWLYDTLERTREVARWTAQVTHNHPEGIKGAESTASAIFLARNGATKDEIKKYVETEFGYDLNSKLDDIRQNYHHMEGSHETVPEAFIAFLESTDFEDAIRNGVSLGGDADTLTCIDGSIAEAFYEIPQNLIEKCRLKIDFKIRKMLDRFNEELK